jgi:hypothetical protein
MLKYVHGGALAVALIGLAGCNTMSSVASALWPFDGGMETKAYACEDGSRMIVVFDNSEDAASVSITGRPMQTLHRQSDEHYWNGAYSLRVNDGMARWEEQPSTTMVCRIATS